jgi:hypothetical protein
MPIDEQGSTPPYASVREVATLTATVEAIKADVQHVVAAVDRLAGRVTEQHTPQWQTIIMGLSFICVTIGALWISAINPIQAVQNRHDIEIVRASEEHRSFVASMNKLFMDLSISINDRFRERDKDEATAFRAHEKEDTDKQHQQDKELAEILRGRDGLFVSQSQFREYVAASETSRARSDKTDDRIIAIIESLARRVDLLGQNERKEPKP